MLLLPTPTPMQLNRGRSEEEEGMFSGLSDGRWRWMVVVEIFSVPSIQQQFNLFVAACRQRRSTKPKREQQKIVQCILNHLS